MAPDRLIPSGLFYCAVIMLSDSGWAGTLSVNSGWRVTPQAGNQPRELRVAAGSQLMLECGLDPSDSANRTDPPQLAWIKDDVELNETLLEADSGGGIRNRLLLDGITPIQQGYYKCVVNGSSSIEFRIDVLSGSGSKMGFRADTVAANVSESIGGTVRMHCSAVVDNGDPDWLPHHQLQIEWLRWIALPENASGQIHPNASVIISSAQFQIVQDDSMAVRMENGRYTKTLSLQRITLADGGSYLCLATNPAGTTWASSWLTVLTTNKSAETQRIPLTTTVLPSFIVAAVFICWLKNRQSRSIDPESLPSGRRSSPRQSPLRVQYFRHPHSHQPINL